MENNEKQIKDIILPSEICTRVSEWHGGMWTPTYSLCSTGLENYVSLEMVEAAADELEAPHGGSFPPWCDADREDLAGELRLILAYPEEFRA
jgi:hypothetical protein